jgi:hypothetical protein
MMAMDYYKRAKQDGSHALAANEERGGSNKEGIPNGLDYTKLPQHHLNANDKNLAASHANKGSPLRNMLK